MMPGIILASGYGSLRRCGYPKTLEPVGDKPMLARIVETAISAGVTDLVVVVNPHSGDKIRGALAGYHGLRFAVQPDRRGAADAIMHGINALPASRDCVVLYGDMPLWRSDTVWRLMHSHLRHGAALSLAPAPLDRALAPELDRYGRVLRDCRGRVCAVVDPRDVTSSEVNPSLWAFDTNWFCRKLGAIPAVPRGDMHPPERSPQPLVELAHNHGSLIGETAVYDPREALGVNSAEELERIRKIASST